ncbi:glycosyltransferase [Microbacterium enclense]|uniref:glycosyltransferase n=1 Tax=Microbacterium enclense TaxID=993073 RepID=UPI0021A74357|nr:glycosyltransferase [Microbacterium enclense]MCT2085763.1 glycosyltransferase [Microbacterium enclense]
MIRVLHTVYPPTAQGNPFASLLIDAVSHETESSYFSWRAAFFRRWDVVHFQWPEKFFAGGSGAVAAAKRWRFRAWMQVLRWRRTAVVWTIHNLATHEDPGAGAARELARLERRVDRYVVLNPAVDIALAAPADIIPHGHYRSLIPDEVRTERRGKRVLYFGFIREYKNVPALVRAFGASELHREGVDLRLVGRPHSHALAQAVGSAVADSAGGVSARLEAVPDRDLYQEIADSSVVVLPYADLYNSGVLVMALSMERPVIVPRTPATEYYREQFGSDWVFLYEPPLAPDVLSEIVHRALHVSVRGYLDLARLDWSALAASYVDTYRRALQARRA